MDTLELYYDVKTVVDNYPEPAALTRQKQFRGYLRQRDRLRWIAEMCAEQWDGDFIEIGAHIGETTRVLAELARQYKRRVIVVDPWETGTPGCNGWEYDVFVDNVVLYKNLIDVIRLSSLDKQAIEQVKARPLCFAYVDGLHAYRACLSDILTVSHCQGIIAVDDIHWNVNLMRAFSVGADATWRLSVLRGTPPMREGYLLPAGDIPRRISSFDVARMVTRAVEEGRPLSVIRLGDGEAMLMEWPHFTERRGPLFQSLRYWFGSIGIGSGDLNDMATELRKAIKESDVIGVPSEQHRQGREGWAKVELYLRAYNLMTRDSVLAPADLHIELYKEGLLKHLLQGRQISVITCRNVAQKLIDEYGVKGVRWYPIPTEAQTAGFKPTNHWPDRYEELMDEIEVPCPGHLFLVGAGALGKAYCAQVKRKGGVALDIGSIFDVWAGVHSRSYMEGML